MQVVLLEQLSSSHDQQACFEPLFLLQKTLICDIICLRVAHAVRRLCALLPHAVDGCLPAPRRRAPAPTNRFGSASSTARSAQAGPRGQAGPSASLFRWDGGEGAAAGCAAGMVSAISEISAPRSRTWHRHAFCLLICENARGRLACWVGVGVSVWNLQTCNFILCSELAGHQPAPSQEQVY